MEVKINREIRNYTEAMFFGLSLRQFIFSACACVVAVGIYFLLKPYVGTETEEAHFPFNEYLLRAVQAEYRSKSKGGYEIE